MTSAAAAGTTECIVLHTGGLHFASEKAVVESWLGRLPGVLAVEANPVAQTATVTFDPNQTSVAKLRRAVEECGLHCAGQSVPGHVCDPLAEPHHETHDEAAALPIAGGVFEPLGFVLRPEVGAISMSGSSIIVALNAVALRRLHLPEPPSR